MLTSRSSEIRPVRPHRRIVRIAATLCLMLPSPLLLASDEPTSDPKEEVKPFSVYTWNCSRSMNQPVGFDSLHDACTYAVSMRERYRSVRVIEGHVEYPYQVMRYENDPSPSAFMVCEPNEDQQWTVVGRFAKAQYAELIAEAWEAEEEAPLALIVFRYELKGGE